MRTQFSTAKVCVSFLTTITLGLEEENVKGKGSEFIVDIGHRQGASFGHCLPLMLKSSLSQHPSLCAVTETGTGSGVSPQHI